MRYFKLELINREETYNRTFGRTPKVGILKTKTSMSTSGTSRKKNTTSHLKSSVSHHVSINGDRKRTKRSTLPHSHSTSSTFSNTHSVRSSPAFPPVDSPRSTNSVKKDTKKKYSARRSISDYAKDSSLKNSKQNYGMKREGYQ